GQGDEAQAFYQRAIDTARRQGALGWEIRAVISAARLWIRLGKMNDAAELLDEICGRAGLRGDDPRAVSGPCAAPRTLTGLNTARHRAGLS
ncbi:MAG TPA: hypothetical protein VN280_12395, partial [Variovorax sp.]|nr:hypothetical protein [Variovorax sp.]